MLKFKNNILLAEREQRHFNLELMAMVEYPYDKSALRFRMNLHQETN